MLHLHLFKLHELMNNAYTNKIKAAATILPPFSTQEDRNQPQQVTFNERIVNVTKFET